MANPGTNNMEFGNLHNIQNEIVVCSVRNAPAGAFWERPKSDAHLLGHNKGQIVTHPDMPFLLRSGQNHILVKGSITLTFRWQDDDRLSNRDIERFVELLNEEMPEDDNLITLDWAAKTITVVGRFNGNKDTFSPIRPSHTLNCASARMELEAGSDFVCVLRTSADSDNWVSLYRDVQAGETVTIPKEGEKSYVIFCSDDVTKDGTTLEYLKPYKISGDSVEVTCPSFTKVVRVHKNAAS